MFKIDLHVHTELGGDSLIDPNEIIAQAQNIGLDAVCVTEHHSYDCSEPLLALSRKSGYPIFRGMEYRAAEGHLLIYGIKTGRGDFQPGIPMQKVADWVYARGGVAIPAHPYQKGLLGDSLADRVLKLKGLCALETLNGSLSLHENEQAAAAADTLGIKGIGGSDAHGIHVLGRAYTCFSAPLRNETDLAQALLSGEYYPCWNDPQFNT
jgi:predicted metal-dependent phosphoesterase TrpH